MQHNFSYEPTLEERISMQEIKKLISIGEKINLQLSNDFYNNEYLSRIENINDDGTFDVLIPMAKNKYIYVKNDAVLNIVVFKEGAVYEFKAKIINKLFEVIPLFRLIAASEVKKVQRRNYYRLKSVQSIKVRKIIDMREMKFEDYFKAFLLDISGGGIAFSSSKELNINDEVEVNLKLNSEIINVFGEIVRKDINYAADSNKNIYGVAFKRISEIERNIITKYIFDEQRKLAKKGMI